MRIAPRTTQSNDCRQQQRGSTHKEANPYLRDLIVAALETGCRRGELQSPTWSQIRWTDNILLLPANKTKNEPTTGDPNDIATSRDAGDAQARPHRTRVPTERIRVWERSRRTSQEHQGRMEERLLASSGIEGLTFHDLRREFASRLLETPGVADHDVRDWLGHANITTTSRYLATTGARRQHTLKRLEDHRRVPSPVDPSADAGR